MADIKNSLLATLFCAGCSINVAASQKVPQMAMRVETYIVSDGYQIPKQKCQTGFTSMVTVVPGGAVAWREEVVSRDTDSWITLFKEQDGTPSKILTRVQTYCRKS